MEKEGPERKWKNNGGRGKGEGQSDGGEEGREKEWRERRNYFERGRIRKICSRRYSLLIGIIIIGREGGSVPPIQTQMAEGRASAIVASLCNAFMVLCVLEDVTSFYPIFFLFQAYFMLHLSAVNNTFNYSHALSVRHLVSIFQGSK